MSENTDPIWFGFLFIVAAMLLNALYQAYALIMRRVRRDETCSFCKTIPNIPEWKMVDPDGGGRRLWNRCYCGRSMRPTAMIETDPVMWYGLKFEKKKEVPNAVVVEHRRHIHVRRH